LHRIRGPEGTRVVLTVRKLGHEAPTTVTVTRRAIQA
jgi:C-terminal processing protease CtpA/Prc